MWTTSLPFSFSANQTVNKSRFLSSYYPNACRTHKHDIQRLKLRDIEICNSTWMYFRFHMTPTSIWYVTWVVCLTFFKLKTWVMWYAQKKTKNEINKYFTTTPISSIDLPMNLHCWADFDGNPVFALLVSNFFFEIPQTTCKVLCFLPDVNISVIFCYIPSH